MLRIGLPVFALVVVGLASIAMMAAVTARGRDNDAREASVRNAVSALSVAEDRLSEIVTDYTRWDEAFLYLHNVVDESWARRNIGADMHRTYGISHVFVFDRHNRMVYQSDFKNEEEAHYRIPHDSSPDYGELHALIEKARAAGTDNQAQVAAIRLAHTVHIAAARRVTLQDAPDAIPGAQSSVLVLVRHFSPTLLERLSGDNTLPHLRVSNENNAAANEVALPIAGVDPAEPAGYLVWRPNLPGTALIKAMAMPLLAVASLMVLLLALVLARARRAGTALDSAAVALRTSHDSLEARVQQRTAELAEAEGRYRGIVENAVEGIFQITPEGKFIGANPAIARILGFSSPEQRLAEASADTILDAHSREAFSRVMGTFGEVIDFISEVRRPDGTKTWIAQNTARSRNPTGRLPITKAWSSTSPRGVRPRKI